MGHRDDLNLEYAMGGLSSEIRLMRKSMEAICKLLEQINNKLYDREDECLSQEEETLSE